MAQPTSFRLGPKLEKRLKLVSEKTGWSKTDIAILGLERLFQENPTADKVFDAVAAYKRERAANG